MSMSLMDGEVSSSEQETPKTLALKSRGDLPPLHMFPDVHWSTPQRGELDKQDLYLGT